MSGRLRDTCRTFDYGYDKRKLETMNVKKMLYLNC